ncbi:MAG: type II toxin-antitoxin system VapC family toxin [Thermomicrobiales bacterium]
MSDVIVDTSLAVKWVLPESHSDVALALAARWRRGQRTIIVPAWFACEVANVFFQRIRQRSITLADAQDLLVEIMVAVRPVDVSTVVGSRALEIAHSLGQRANYDAYYLALAEHLDCELWSADERFWRAAHPVFPWARWIGEETLGHS